MQLSGISYIWLIIYPIIKENHVFADINYMNLHEECLLKYLINPVDLFRTTELLKLSNSLIEKDKLKSDFLAKKVKVNYTGIV